MKKLEELTTPDKPSTDKKIKFNLQDDFFLNKFF